DARAVRGEEGDDLGDLRRVGRTTDRGIGAVFGEEATTILHEVIEEVGYDIADTDRVDADAVLDRLERLSTRQLGKGTLRGGVGRDARESKVGRIGRDVNNRPRLLRHHHLGGLARVKEG